jgi:hypothetical protein
MMQSIHLNWYSIITYSSRTIFLPGNLINSVPDVAGQSSTFVQVSIFVSATDFVAEIMWAVLEGNILRARLDSLDGGFMLGLETAM